MPRDEEVARLKAENEEMRERLASTQARLDANDDKFVQGMKLAKEAAELQRAEMQLATLATTMRFESAVHRVQAYAEQLKDDMGELDAHDRVDLFMLQFQLWHLAQEDAEARPVVPPPLSLPDDASQIPKYSCSFVERSCWACNGRTQRFNTAFCD